MLIVSISENGYPDSVAEIDWQIVEGYIIAMILGLSTALPFTLAQATLPEFNWKRESADLMAIILAASLTLILACAVKIGVDCGRTIYPYHHALSSSIWRGVFDSAWFLKNAGHPFMQFLGLNIFFSFLLFFCLPFWLRLFYSRLFAFCRVKRIDFFQG